MCPTSLFKRALIMTSLEDTIPQPYMSLSYKNRSSPCARIAEVHQRPVETLLWSASLRHHRVFATRLSVLADLGPIRSRNGCRCKGPPGRAGNEGAEWGFSRSHNTGDFWMLGSLSSDQIGYNIQTHFIREKCLFGWNKKG